MVQIWGKFWRRFSHIGRRPITIEPHIAVNLTNMSPLAPTKFGKTSVSQMIHVVGPLGSLQFPLYKGLRLSVKPGTVPNEKDALLEIDADTYDKSSKYCKKFLRGMWGTTASILRNHVEGVGEGFSVSLRLVGVGYKAILEQSTLVLKLGFSHDVKIPIPEGVRVSIPLPTKIVLFGIDYQKITQFAAKIRAFRKPEPYNGKGIFIGNETIKLKEGKKK